MEMKLLLIGCIHGKVTPKLRRIFGEDFDAALYSGDLVNGDVLRKIEFDHWREIKEEGKDFEDFLSKKEYIGAYNKTIQSSEKVLDFLNNLGCKVLMIYGNHDLPETIVKRLKYKKFPSLERKLKKRKNIVLLKAGIANFRGYQIMGKSYYRSYLLKYPGKNNKDIGRIKRINKEWDNSLKEMFFKMKDHKKAILLTHEPPRNVFDRIGGSYKNNPVAGKHIGDEYVRKAILKNNPLVHVCSHMHEYQGKKMLGKTMVISSGPGFEGKFAILEIEEGKIKKVKFFR